MSLENDIIECLSNSRRPLKASEIKDIIGTTRHEVNSFLYSNKNKFKINSNYEWSLKRPLERSNNPFRYDTFGVMDKLQNKENAKVYDRAYFDSLANWHFGVSPSGLDKGFYYAKCGNKIQCDSKSEIIMLQYLEDNNLIKACGGQSLTIYYDTEYRSACSYSPDIVVLTVENHIAIIEVKSLTAMDNHSNMEKYRALASYCEEYGYEYMMVDPVKDFTTFDELYNMPVSQELIDIFNSMIAELENGEVMLHRFDEKDVDTWYNNFGWHLTKEEFRIQVHSMVVYHNWYNKYKNGFKVYSQPVKVSGNNNKDIEYVEYNKYRSRL